MADLLEQAHGAVDKFVTGIGNALGVDFDDGDSNREFDDVDVKHARVALPPALPDDRARLALPAPAVVAPALPAPFEIIERDGRVCVTNGLVGQVCPDREFAEQVLKAMIAAATPRRTGRQ